MTNDKGIARVDDLPLGKYYLVETKTIDGFVLDDTPIEADLSYIDQNTKVVFAGMDVTNERQKVQITITLPSFPFRWLCRRCFPEGNGIGT